MARAVIYARVSTAFQVNGTSVEGQLSEVRAWAEKNGYEVVAEYTDEAESGRSAERTNFRKMLSEVEAYHVAAVLCWKHSRLFRNMEEAILHKHLLSKKNIKLISINEPIEDGPVGQLIEHILLAINEFYCGNLAEDSLRGLCELVRQGYLPNMPQYGYKAVAVVNDRGYTKHKAVVDEPAAAVVRKIYQYGAQGYSLCEICEKLKHESIASPTGNPRWSPAMIHVILAHRQELYAQGTYTYNKVGHKGALNPIRRKKSVDEWVVVHNAVPPIVPQELVDEYNRVRQRKRIRPREDQKCWPARENYFRRIVLREDIQPIIYRTGWFIAEAKKLIVIEVKPVRVNKDIAFSEALRRRGFAETKKDSGQYYFGWIKEREFYAVTSLLLLP